MRKRMLRAMARVARPPAATVQEEVAGAAVGALVGSVQAVRALAINLWYGSVIFCGPLTLGKKCSLTKCDVMGHKH